MTRDELEFSISQYLDGSLASSERDAIEERLATDAEARAMFAEYQSLQNVLASAEMPLVNWDALSSQISDAVSQVQEPTQTYQIGRWLRPAMALAASVVVAAGMAFSVMRTTPATNSPAVASTPITIVKNDVRPDVQIAPVATGTPTLQIAVGPAPSTGGAPIVLRYADSVVQRPSKALIVSAAPAVQDSLLTPF